MPVHKRTHRPKDETQTTVPALPDDAALNTAQASQYLGLSPSTLRNWRSISFGPRYYKATRSDGGGRVFYTRADLDAFRENAWVVHTPPPGAQQRRAQ